MSIKRWMCALAAVLGFGCNSTTEAQTLVDASQAIWVNETKYANLLDGDADTRQSIKIAKINTNYKNYNPRFKLGNLCLIDASTPPAPNVMDASGKHVVIGVILGTKPRVVIMPDDKLLVQFMIALRANPDALKPERKYRAIGMLAGTRSPMSKKEMENDSSIKMYHVDSRDPDWWEDKNGKISFNYYTLQANGMMAPILVRCTITLDVENHLEKSCEPVALSPSGAAWAAISKNPARSEE